MRTSGRSILALSLTLLLAACGDVPDPEPVEEQQPGTAPEAGASGEITTPDWYEVDHDAQTVDLHLIAGETSDNNYWNFNGFYGGEGEVVVPVGYTVNLRLENQDPNMAHSAGVGPLQQQYPASFEQVDPVFEGAVTPNPTSATEATGSGETDEVSFVASEAGEYALICYVPAHAVTGMWVPFTVSDEGEAGVRQ